MSRRPLLPALRRPRAKPAPTGPLLDLKAAPAKTWRGLPVALALGGGGARGFAHIAVFEALDELGIRPVAISGTSIGAILGATYAAGFTGRRLRQHVLETFRNGTGVFQKLFETRVGRFADLLQGLSNPVLVDGEAILRRFWPDTMPETFEGLDIPFTAIAGDIVGRSEVRLDTGALHSAVAGSMAIPGLVKPVEREGHVLIDGFVVNPVPVDVLEGRAPIVVAVDLQLSGSRFASREPPKNPYEALLQASALMELSLTNEKFRVNPPTIRLAPDVARFAALDFLKVRDILKAAEPVKADLVTRLRAFEGRALAAP